MSERRLLTEPSEARLLAELSIAHDFRGAPLPVAHHAQLRLWRDHDQLRVDVDAPFFADPAPAAAVGATDRLWEYEVCELFIADEAEHYLEVELSPHGHHLVLELAGVRRAVRSCLPIDYSVHVEHGASAARAVQGCEPVGRYRGSARVPWHYLPAGAARANAYLIHGTAPTRCYCAHSPPFGEVADFHRLSSFVAVQLA